MTHNESVWVRNMREENRRRQDLIVRLRLRIAKSEAEGKPTDQLRAMLEDVLHNPVSR